MHKPNVIPKDATHIVDGLPHKVGLHGYIYYYDGIQWVLSSKSKNEMWRGRRIA